MIDTNLKIFVNYKDIKNMYLRLDGNKIIVTCNKYTKEKDIIDFVNGHQAWIIKHLNDNQQKRENSKLVFSDTVYYFGKQYNLLVKKGNPRIFVEGLDLIVYCRDIDKFQDTFYSCGVKQLDTIIKQLEPKYLAILADYNCNIIPSYKYRKMKRAWGVCYPKKELITFNSLLVHFDLVSIEAIMWHEYLHFILPNHSKRFHEVLEFRMPNYRQIIRGLY